jgi:spermidine synthase
VPVLFAFTLLIGAFLTFLVQPMAARMILPYYGGSPAVWNTCVVFFQVSLLAGYAYAHFTPAPLGLRRHAGLHLLLMLLPFVLLPLSVSASWAPPPDAPPALWLLATLAVGIGLPFFAVAATAPLAQRWFAATGHHSAGDPYYLYAASNLGSMAGLLGYPFVVETQLDLTEQSWFWTAGYALLVVLMAACAACLWLAPRTPRNRDENRAGDDSPPNTHHSPLTAHDFSRLRWAVLAFIPSSLMLSATTYLTSYVAPIPLLWVVPLALYLLTFILTFTRRPPIPHALVSRLLPLVVLLIVLLLLANDFEPPIWLLSLHLLALLLVGLLCHGLLARSRPEAGRLTEFYLWLAVGGALGGMFNAVIAPIVFMKTGPTEYPLVLILACFFRGPLGEGTKVCLRRDLLPPVVLWLVALAFIVLARSVDLPLGPLRFGVAFGVPAVICYTFIDRPVRFGLGLGALLIASVFYVGDAGRPKFLRRDFFGVHRVTEDATAGLRKLFHGNTVHGMESLHLAERDEPLTYYCRSGPIGRLFRQLNDSDTPPRRVAVVGLGAGSLVCYARAGQDWTFYEIDPVVVEVAQTQFSFLKDSRTNVNVEAKMVLGDARLRLEQATGQRYDVLVIDAFNSDSVPVHLLTREALSVYRQRLTNDGILAFHISHRFLDFEPVLAALADDAGLAAYQWLDAAIPEKEGLMGKYPSYWVFMCLSRERSEFVSQAGMWTRASEPERRYLWTDRYSNLFGILRNREW